MALVVPIFGCCSVTRSSSSSGGSSSSSSRGEMHELLSLLPGEMQRELRSRGRMEELVEVVLDLGRRPVARYPDGDSSLSQEAVTPALLEDAICMVGDFGDDNRAGIDRTLHRISAIRNRGGRIVGLTCRVGRAVSGSADMARDLVSSGGSLLLMGPPGVGKTTVIREVSRMLADDYNRRVVIVDTSNEIAGDGDIPHPGIGRARRMQVPNVELQHKLMIEAVENHMPETIVVDEIGTELEALAAVTIAQRGVQLVATAHGSSVENLIKNPSLQILAGGIQSVTLGDEEARRRGVQKSVLERKGPPTFTSAIEMLSRTEWRIHHSLSATIDALLAGGIPLAQTRKVSDKLEDNPGEEQTAQQYFIYPYEVSEELLKQAIDVLELQDALGITSDIQAANGIFALRTKLKDNVWVRSVAKLRQLPILALKANTLAQMIRATRTLVDMEDDLTKQLERYHAGRKSKLEDEIDALEEARLAVEQIVIGKGQPVELLPRCAEVTQLQIRLVESYQLSWETFGFEPQQLRLRILPRLGSGKQPMAKEDEEEDEDDEDVLEGRLPLLPE